MSDVKSTNPYDLLGNTIDSDDETKPPVIPVDKPVARSGKRDAPKAAPVAPAGRGGSGAGAGAGAGAGGRGRGGFTGSEAAFRDRTTGRTFNKAQTTDEPDTGVRGGRDGGPGARRGRGGRGGPRRGGDRRDRTGQNEHPKQADQSWGEPTGDGEWADEKAGDAIAKAEVKEGGFDTTTEAPVDAEGNTFEDKEAEPEDTHKSYSDYLAEQAAKKEAAAALGLQEARQANEGTKTNKKWDSAKALTKESDEDYFAGQEKSRRERERTAKKEFLDLDYSFKEQPRESRGGRGGGGGGRGGRGGRGDRGRGDFGDRGRGDFGGRGGGDSGSREPYGGRGDFGGRGRGRGGSGRGRGGAEGPAVAVNDQSAFPSLGA